MLTYLSWSHKKQEPFLFPWISNPFNAIYWREKPLSGAPPGHRHSDLLWVLLQASHTIPKSDWVQNIGFWFFLCVLFFSFLYVCQFYSFLFFYIFILLKIDSLLTQDILTRVYIPSTLPSSYPHLFPSRSTSFCLSLENIILLRDNNKT